jgi:hypothetical protein
MKSLVLVLGLLTLNAGAQTLNCQWLESTEHSVGFYRPAKIQRSFEYEKVVFVEDTFLYRTYSPCWVGRFSSCAFGFGYKGNTWAILSSGNSNGHQSFEIEAPGFYWDAQLSLTFEKNIESLSRSEAVKAVISGDDGDGVMFSNESFLCQKI